MVGEPGVGSPASTGSSLGSHRDRQLAHLGERLRLLRQTTAYLPVIDLLKAYFHIERRDETRTIREKVTGKVLSLDRALEPSLSALLSAPGGPGRG